MTLCVRVVDSGPSLSLEEVAPLSVGVNFPELSSVLISHIDFDAREILGKSGDNEKFFFLLFKWTF